MKYAVRALILALSMAIPLSSASAVDRDWGAFCTTGLSLNFCGSVQVSASTNSDGGTDVVLTVLNTSGGVSGGDYRAVFTAVGLDNIGISDLTTFSQVAVWMNGQSYSGWQIEINRTRGGGVNVDMYADTQNGINNGISSACGPLNARIATGGIGGCPDGAHTVAISFAISETFDLGEAQLVIKAQGFNSSTCIIGSECAPVAVPEPASLGLLGTGLIALALAGRRRRRSTRYENDCVPPSAAA